MEAEIIYAPQSDDRSVVADVPEAVYSSVETEIMYAPNAVISSVEAVAIYAPESHDGSVVADLVLSANHPMIRGTTHQFHGKSVHVHDSHSDLKSSGPVGYVMLKVTARHHSLNNLLQLQLTRIYSQVGLTCHMQIRKC